MLQAPFQDTVEVDVRGTSSMRSFGDVCLIEVTIGEIKSNADVSGACRQLSIALAVLERVIGVLAAPRASTRELAKSSGTLRQAVTAPGAVVISQSSASAHDTLPMAPFYRALELEQQRGALPPSAFSDSGSGNLAVPPSWGPTADIAGARLNPPPPSDEAVSAAPSPAAPSPTVAVQNPMLRLDYRLTGLIFAAKASAAYAEGRGLDLAPDVEFVDCSKIHICLSG